MTQANLIAGTQWWLETHIGRFNRRSQCFGPMFGGQVSLARRLRQ